MSVLSKSTRDTQSRIDQLVNVELPAADKACQVALDSEDDANAWSLADKHRSDLQIELRRLRDLLPGQSQREAAEAEAAAVKFVGRPALKPYRPHRFEPVLGPPPPFSGSDLRQQPGEPDVRFRDRQKGILGWVFCPEEGDQGVPFTGLARWVLPSQRPDLVLQLELEQGVKI